MARLAGYSPVGVLVEILNEDGTLARLPQLLKIAGENSLKLVSIKDLVAYRMKNERLIERVLCAKLPEEKGGFYINVYRQLTNGDLHFALHMGNWQENDPVLVRVHSSTETGDIMGTLFDDYGLQLKRAVRKIKQEGKGILLYMRHSEKSSHIIQKIKSISGIEEEEELGKEQRDFGIGAQI